MIEEIKGRLPLYEATITDDLHYQMVEDISSLLILFDAQKSAKEEMIKDILYWADNIADCWWLDCPNKGGYGFNKLRELL